MPIHPRYRHSLAFQTGAYTVQFRVLPFRLGVAPLVFTKLTKEVAKVYVEHGIHPLFYQDNWLFIIASASQATSHVSLARSLAEGMGFSFNLNKSSLLPSQVLKWIGMCWDTRAMTASLSQANQQKIVAKLWHAIFCHTS